MVAPRGSGAGGGIVKLGVRPSPRTQGPDSGASGAAPVPGQAASAEGSSGVAASRHENAGCPARPGRRRAQRTGGIDDQDLELDRAAADEAGRERGVEPRIGADRPDPEDARIDDQRLLRQADVTRRQPEQR
jgi:hypothetical protein